MSRGHSHTNSQTGVTRCLNRRRSVESHSTCETHDILLKSVIDWRLSTFVINAFDESML